ncbi:hypothetical protein GTW40_10745 [Streptomyces sp. SID4985]|uniref:hypothetical protein n=1 Tax=Streptomyces sp. SID4985 TaxID=2690292 RepID=UPI00136D1B1E|nr:hypothetical protein [Streptomyces sp. SID4985]MYQ45533.1 hypothetical protein [Streptomyces sp. SID4985]
MSRFNTRAQRPAARDPATTTGKRTATHEGGAAYVRDAKSELFLLAVTNMVGQQSFYESAEGRDNRYRRLVGQLAVEDPAWTSGLLGWLRSSANMRSAAIVGAAGFVHARQAAVAKGPAAIDTSQPNRYEIGGFSDQLFTMVDLLSRGREAGWPWERPV